MISRWRPTGRNLARVSYATSLMKKGVLISTTEHLLSAFIGTGIDNAMSNWTTSSCRSSTAVPGLLWK